MNEKKSENIMLSMPDNENSISISTIHKSKGLEYPAVIIPIYDDKLDENLSRELIWLYEPFENLKDLRKNIFYHGKEKIKLVNGPDINSNFFFAFNSGCKSFFSSNICS